MDYSEDFFEDEVRCGFYIPSNIKRAWAIGMDVLFEVERICQKYNIKYWVDWGTLIGAVRHGGFIPWDDDIDISMMREDYNRFMKVAQEEIGDRFCLYTYRENKEYWGFVTRMTVKDRICFEPEHLERCHQFPYICGLDIFIWDYVNRDFDKDQERCKIARTLIEFADEVCENSHDVTWVKNGLSIIKEKTGFNADINLFLKDKTAFRVAFYEEAEKYFAAVKEEDADVITRMMPDGLYTKTILRIPKKYFDDVIHIPFEDIKVPVPLVYDEMLRVRYGNYMEIIKNQSGHDYPFFASQENNLIEILKKENITLRNEYKYVQNQISLDNSNSYKTTILSCINEMENLVEDLSNEIESKLINLQQYAIDIGTFIEKIRGEGTNSVKELEILCENIFNVFEGNGDISVIAQSFAVVKEVVYKEIINKKLTVFLVSKAKDWIYFSNIYEEKKLENDVLVIPVPYFHKRFDGSPIDEIYEYDRFASICEVVRHDEIDLSLLMPEEIFIQQPFDQYNSCFSVNPYYYSSNIRKYTKKLIYIPAFITDDFSEVCEREYINMKYYCTMPGVVNADEVFVNSMQTRKMYVRKLVEFAGEDTRTLWENKIKINPWGISKTAYIIEKPEWKTDKKRVLYFCGISEALHHKKEYFEKVKINLKTFCEEKDEVMMFLAVQDGLRELLEKNDSELVKELDDIIDYVMSSSFAKLIETKDLKNIELIADAYYGDVNSIVQEFRKDGKPVMIQKVL